jgi:UDP-glucose 4-epimerase|tara:strand:- start:1568 stop:2488 length:921 start_codon:yes stop_codon:yes gene_type:complete
MRILITGVAGFIGSNLADYLLKKGYEIVGIDDLSYGLIEQVPPKVEFHETDITDREIFSLFDNIDIVFHLAAKNCISDCQLDPVETTRINVGGTVNVFEAAKQAAVKKIVYAESSAVYEGSSFFPTPEEDENPESFYAVSKMAGKLFADAYIRFSELNLIALRYFNVYGPRQDYRRSIPPLMCALIMKLLKSEQPIIYGNGEKRRDFIYVDDVNRFHELLITNPNINNNTFNIGFGKNYSVLEVFKIISKLLNSQIEPVHKPDLPGEAFQNLADISRAKDIGWEPQVNLEKGLELSIAYIRKYILN